MRLRIVNIVAVRTGVQALFIFCPEASGTVKELNTHDLKFVIHLGDFIDRDYDSFDKVLPIYQTLKMPAYHASGNHD